MATRIWFLFHLSHIVKLVNKHRPITKGKTQHSEHAKERIPQKKKTDYTEDTINLQE